MMNNLSLFEATTVASFCEAEDADGFALDTICSAARTLAKLQPAMDDYYQAVCEEILRRVSPHITNLRCDP